MKHMSRSVSKEHAEQTDLVIATKFSKYTEIRRSEGFVAARRAAVDDLTACIVWLDAIAGTRAPMTSSRAAPITWLKIVCG